MARASIDVIGDSASAVRALDQTTAAVLGTDDAMKKLAVDAEATTVKMVQASTQRIARLEAEAAAARQLSATYVAGSREQAAAAELAARRTASANRLLGVTTAAAAASGLAVAGTVGRGLTTYVTAPAAFVGYEAVKNAIEFNRQMLLLQTQAGASAAEVRNLTGEVLKLAPAVGMGPTQLAEGLYHLESIGLRGSKALDTLRISAYAAGQGIANLEDVTTALGGVVVTGIQGAQNFQDAMNTLVATVGAGNVRFEDLASSIGNVAPAAAAAGITLPELGAAIATLTDRGFGADEAATRLRMSFALIQAPSLKAQKALADMGINALALGAMLRQPNGLLNVLETLHAGLQRVGDVRGNRDLLAGFGGGRSGLGIQTLVQSLDSSLSSYQQKLQQVQADEAKAAAAHQAFINSPSFKLHQDLAEIQADLVKIGATLTPLAVDAARVGTGIADAFNALPGPIKSDVGVLVGLLAVGGPLALAISGVGRLVEGIGNAFSRLPAAAAPGITATEVEVAGIGTSATAATAEVSGLRGVLAGLGTLGPIAIPITIAISYELQQGFTDAHGRSLGVKIVSGAAHLGKSLGSEFPGLGAVSSIEQAIINATAPGPAGTQTTVQTGANNPFEPGGALNTLTGLTGTQPPGDAFKAAAQAYLRAHPGATGAQAINKFVLPYKIQLEQSQAALTKSTTDDVQAARDVVAYAKQQIDSGHLTHAAMLQAINEEGSALNTMWAAQSSAAKKAADAAKKAAKAAETFSLPLAMQLAQARADALAALDPSGQGSSALQIKLANEEKSAAMKAINSHTLTIQAMIDAWRIVSQANSVLAQAAGAKGAIGTYHAVSTRALTAGLGLAHDTRVELEERYAQAAAHRGYVPNQIGASGGGGDINIENVTLQGINDAARLFWELDHVGRSHRQRRGQR